MKERLCFLSFLLILACGANQDKPPQVPTSVTASDTVNVAAKDDESSFENTSTATAFKFGYRLDKPDATFTLPGKLAEISGLSLSADGRFLVAVNDEKGKIFFLEKETGKVKEEITFGNHGDYEGIEMVGDKIYVLKSNGTIYEVKKAAKKQQEVASYNTRLDENYDVEGLGYDSAADRLLLACKGKAVKGKEFKKMRAVYAFDLKEKELSKEPVFLIDRDDIEKWLSDGKADLTRRLAEFFDPKLADDAFAPSGIAVHPTTKNIYILSSVGKILVVLNPKGKILHVEPLDPDLHKQPEGICFDTDGTLYLSSEGGKGKGKIFRFKMG